MVYNIHTKYNHPQIVDHHFFVSYVYLSIFFFLAHLYMMIQHHTIVHMLIHIIIIIINNNSKKKQRTSKKCVNQYLYFMFIYINKNK